MLGATMAQGMAPAPASASEPGSPPYVDRTSRLSGADRYATAVRASQKFPAGVPAAFIAPGLDFPDALAAGSAAGKLGAPILLTGRSQISQGTLTELRRLKPARIYLVGGTGVIDSAVEKRVREISRTTRIGGKDRYETGRLMLREFFPTAPQVLVATGRSFPDALSASAVSGARKMPLLLLDGNRSDIDSATQREIQRLRATKFTVIGGTGAVSAGVQNNLARKFGAVSRLGGADRFGTSAQINAAFPPSNAEKEYFVASGFDFPDALSGAALAARQGSALYLTQRDCFSLPASDGTVDLGLRKNVILGGKSVVGEGAARAARCVQPAKPKALSNWATTGWTMPENVAVPYFDRPPVNVNDPAAKVDSTGLFIYMRVDRKGRADHPVAYAQYGISALMEYEKTHDARWLDRAIRQADQLQKIRVERDGAWWFPYRFPWSYYGRKLTTPWWSGMAQGEALSLFSRLAEVTGDARWRTASDATWKSFTQPYSATGPWAPLVIDRHLYFEEYAGNLPPLLVLNGHLFGAFGLYDYWKLTGSPAALRAFDGAATTTLNRFVSLVRVEGGVSYYCVQAGYCAVPGWQNQKYHGIHSWQLDTLARLTGDARFSTWASTLRADTPGLGPVSTDPTPDQTGEPLFSPDEDPMGLPDEGAGE